MTDDERLLEVLDDLESEAEAAYADERAVELSDRSRAEYAAVTLVSRLAASLDAEVALTVRGCGTVRGTLQRVAGTWCLVAGPSGEWVVALAHVSAVVGASSRSLPEAAWSLLARLGLGTVLRRLADEEAECTLHTTEGQRHQGVVTRVGADFVELRAPHDPSAGTAYPASGHGDSDGSSQEHVSPVTPPRTVLVALPTLAAITTRT